MDVLFDHSLPYHGDTINAASFLERTRSTKSNYIGAAIFWLYIIAALYFLWDIVRTLVVLHKFAVYRRYAFSASGVLFFSSCAALSFSSLSYHMLNVLVQSYVAWARAQNTALPSTTSDVLQTLFSWAPGSGKGRPSSLSLGSIIQWSISSSLFVDFAHDITSNAARWTWAQADLGITLVTAYWMGIQGRRGAGSSPDAPVTPVPKLWTFFFLLQILPPSLTQSLFMVALLLTPPSTIGDNNDKGTGRRKTSELDRSGISRSESADAKKTVLLLGKPGYWITTGLLYCFILVEATQPERRPWLIWMVLLARTLLWAPLVLPFARLTMSASGDEKGGVISDRKQSKQNKQSSEKGRKMKGKLDDKDKEGEEETMSAEVERLTTAEIVDRASPMQLIDLPLALSALCTCAVLHQGYWAVQEASAGADAGSGFLYAEVLHKALHEHPAVSALGFDFLIGLFTFAAWQVYGRKLAAYV